MKRLAIIGSGALGKHIASFALDAGFEIAGYYDDFYPDNEGVLGTCNDIESDFEKGVFDELIVAIGYKHVDFRREVFMRFKGKVPYANIIHTSSYVDSSVKMGEGIVLGVKNVVDMNTVIEDNVMINFVNSVAHDCRIGAHSFLTSNCAIAGFVTMGESCFMGINCAIVDDVDVCGGTRLAASSVITKPVSEPGLYAGVPAVYKKP